LDEEYDPRLIRESGKLRAFLIAVTNNRDALYEFVNNRFDFLATSGLAKDLSEGEKALLFETDYARIQEVMSQSSAPARWIVIWIV
jgi:hypothetical protein